MPSAYHVHPEFGYFCPTPRRPSSPFRFGACACVQPCVTHPSRQRMPQPPHRPQWSPQPHRWWSYRRAQQARERQSLHLTRRSRRRQSRLPPRSRSGKGSHTFKAVAAMMRELVIHGTTIVRTIGLAAPMPMLTICALDNVCGEGNSSTRRLQAMVLLF